jgi:DNA-directed RNA polymerase specialized sigma24 family protein
VTGALEDFEIVDDAAFRAWYLEAVLRDDELLSVAERDEFERWPGGRREDARVAALVVAGRADSPEVRAWVTRFHRTALAYLHRWGRSAEDADDLVQGFWRYAFKTRLFAKYIPRHAALGTYMFRCFVNRVHHEARVAAGHTDTVPVEDQVIVAPGPSALEAAEAQELRRRTAKCLASLGMAEGEPGWLIQQVHLEERSYASVAEQLFEGEPPEDRLKQAGRLRKRVFSALAKLRECMTGTGVDGQ